MANDAFDPAKARMAVEMVSHMFPPGRMPRPKTDISKWTADMTVQTSWSAQLNGPLKDGAALYRYGWHRITAAEIEECKQMRDLVGIVYEKLVAPPAQQVSSAIALDKFMTSEKVFMQKFHKSIKKGQSR